ncbi:hypothetical protein ATCC90586_009707 [Pythium insidiosum]|nr:hypothetical protein ATCC90586_009707 [Pythium insidiosum]
MYDAAGCTSNGSAVEYELVAVTKLPVINATRTIKAILLSKDRQQRFSRFQRRFNRVIVGAYFIGLVVRVVGITLPYRVGQALFLVVPLLQVPALSLQWMSLRVEFLGLLTRSFEFWFFSVTNTSWLVLFGFVFHDVRAALAPVVWLEAEAAKLADTSLSAIRTTVYAGVVIAAFVTALSVGILTAWIENLEDVQIAAIDTYSLTAQDIIINAMFTITVLLLRISYRRHDALRKAESSASTTVVRCIMVRTKLCWQRLTHSTAPTSDCTSSSSRPSPGPVSSSITSIRNQNAGSCLHKEHSCYGRTRLLVLRATPIDERFLLINTLGPHTCTLHHQLSPPQRIALQLTGLVGILSTAIAASAVEIDARIPSHSRVINLTAAVLAIIGTASYCGAFCLHLNRQILRRLATSFDVVFLLVQIILMHLAVCDMVSWDLAPTVGVLCSGLWITWVLTLDALAPEMKRRLGNFRGSTTAAPVVGVYLVALVLVVFETLWWRRWDLRNRVLLDVGGLRLSVWSLLFGRLLTVLVWCCRLLYRISWARASDDELVMLRGNVEYELESNVATGKRSLVAIAPLPESI